jgi:hypothetical protein
LDNTQSERKGANHLNVELDVSGGFLHLKAWNIFDFWLGTWTYEKGIKLIIVECLKELVWDENLKYLKFFERAFEGACTYEKIILIKLGAWES